METRKVSILVQQMFDEGQVCMIDPRMGILYSLVARCPKDGEYSHVESFEKVCNSLKRVTFKCPICSRIFEVPKAEIMVI